MMLFAQLLLREVRLLYLVFNHRFNIRFLEYISSKRGHTDFYWDYSLHPISEREGGNTGWCADCSSIGLKHPGEFIHPLAFS